MNENLERQNIELTLGRKLQDYEWFAMKIAHKIVEDLNVKKVIPKTFDVKDIKGYRANGLIIDDFTVQDL